MIGFQIILAVIGIYILGAVACLPLLRLSNKRYLLRSSKIPLGFCAASWIGVFLLIICSIFGEWDLTIKPALDKFINYDS